VAEAQIKITADTSQAENNLKGLDNSLRNLGKSTADAAKFFAGLTAASAAVGYAIKQTLDSAGALVDASNRLGVSAANLNRLQQAASLAGIGADELNATIQRLNRNIGEGLQKATAPSAVALKNLNLNIQEISRLKPDQQFELIAQRLIAIESPAQRTALAMELLGKQGPAVLQLANELEKVKRITEEAGLVVTERDLIALDEAGDAISELGILWNAGINKAVAALAPYIVGFVVKLKEAIREAGGFDAIFARIKETAHTIANVISIMAVIMATRLVVATAQLAIQMGRAALAAKSFSVFLSRTPIGLLTAGVAILADKIGIDLVGGSKELNQEQSLYEIGLAEINKAETERTNKLGQTYETYTAITDEQLKQQETARSAFKSALQDSDANIRYQQDLLSVGKDQADVNKTLVELRNKYREAGIQLTPIEQAKLTANLNQANALERQNALLQNQKSLVEGYVNTLRPGEKLVQDIENLRRTVAGQPIIAQVRINTADELATQSRQALSVAQRQAGEFADSAIAQYSKLYGEAFQITNDYNRATRELDDALIAARAAGGDQEIARVQAIEEAKLAIRENANRRTMEMEIARFENATRTKDLEIKLESSRYAESLRNQQDVFGNNRFNQQQLMEIADERTKFEKKTELEKAQFAIQQGADMFNALGAQNKKAFEIAKAFNIANAIMNTYAAATKALAAYPPPFNFIAAAAAVGMGFAQVAAIRSQTYSGRALGGPVVGGQSYMVGEKGVETFRPSTAGTIIPNDQIGGGATNVTFNIVANDTRGFDQLLLERRPLITKIIRDAQLEQGRRQI
jgi:hypothetical protein